MSPKSSCYVLLRLTLLLVMLYEARSVPALETTPVTTAVNSLEETDKLPETNTDANAVQDGGLVGANNATSPAEAGATDAQDQAGVS